MLAGSNRFCSGTRSIGIAEREVLLRGISPPEERTADTTEDSFQDLAKMMTMNSLTASAHVIGKYATIQDGSEEISGKVVSTSLKEGEVFIKLQVEDGKEITAKLGSIISLSEKEQVKKEYKVLPGNEALTEA